jgi:hypothetical protein
MAMTDEQAVIYLAMLSVSLLFTVLAFNRKFGSTDNVIFSFFSFVCWLTMGPIQMIVAAASGLWIIAYLFYGFGAFFLIYGLGSIVQLMHDSAAHFVIKRTEKRESDETDSD